MSTPQAIQWPTVTIGGEEFTLKFTWYAINSLARDGVNFYSPFGEPRMDDGSPPAPLPQTPEEQTEHDIVTAKIVAAGLSSPKRKIDWEYVMENTLPHEVLLIHGAIREATGKLLALTPKAAAPAATTAAQSPDTPS